MRPHVELIQEQDYVWHPAELPHGEGDAFQRNLSVDEEDGSASLRVDFRSDFSRPAGRHAADTEWYVLEGEVRVGDRILGSGGYVQVPKGMVMPPAWAEAGTRILLFREGGDWGFDIGESVSEEHLPFVVESGAMGWHEVTTPGPDPGLMIKPLYRSSEGDLVTRLVWAQPGWIEERLEHHAIFEEAFTLSGSAGYNFGELAAGTYFFRPPGIKHGRFVSAEPDGCVWLIRSGGDIVNFYTTDAEVVVEGKALNYDSESQGPEIAGFPVRSRSAGPWDGTGR